MERYIDVYICIERDKDKEIRKVRSKDRWREEQKKEVDREGEMERGNQLTRSARK